MEEERKGNVAGMERVAGDGRLGVAGAVSGEAAGSMIGSITVTRHATHEAAQAWMAEDPYVKGGVWQDITLHATRLAALPYRPLPGGA